MIAERTKAALAAKKAQGARLGNPRNIAAAGTLGRAALVSGADQFAANLLPAVRLVLNLLDGIIPCSCTIELSNLLNRSCLSQQAEAGPRGCV
jgi:hypothetical protein